MRLLAATTMWRVPRAFKLTSNVGPTARANIRAGVSNVMMMNALVRTTSRYSRRATRKILCNVILCIRPPHHFDEDVFQTGFHNFEFCDARAFRDHFQDRMWISARCELQPTVAGVFLEMSDTGHGLKIAGITGIVGGKPYLERVLTVTGFDLFEVPLQYAFRFVDEADVIA